MSNVSVRLASAVNTLAIGDIPQRFAANLKNEVEKWAAVVRASAARVD